MNHLEYPITKAQILKGYELKDQIRDKLKKEYIENYIKEQLDLITSNIMKQTISPSEYTAIIDINEKKRIDEKNRIMDRIKETQKYIYRFSDINSFISLLVPSIKKQMSTLEGNIYCTEITTTKKEYEEIKITIYTILQTRFPDILIQIDPLKEYILIDWS